MSKKWYDFFVVTENPAGRAPRAPTPAAPPRRVADVAAATPAVEIDAATAGAPTAGGIAEVYAAARIEAPPHGYTVLKVAEMLKSEHILSLPAEVKRKSVLVALDAAGVPVEAIVEDAVRRDRALDTYERVLEQHVETVRSAKQAENATLEEEIAARVAELRGRIDRNNQEVGEESAALAAWRVRKQQEEAVIAETVGHFVTENPVTSSPPAPGSGDADVR